LLSPAPCVVDHTLTCREVHGFPNSALVLTELLGGGVLVYSCTNDAVYSIDFEGGAQAFISGVLEPRWASFEAFLAHYFAP
jgi:hypothetical protein